MMRGISTFLLRGFAPRSRAHGEAVWSPRRLFWVGLLLVHSVGLWLAWGRVAADPAGGSALVEVVALSMSLAFFVLKIADVGFLRLNPGWRSFMAASVIVALLHFNVLHRVVDKTALTPVSDIAWAQVVGTALLVESVRRIARHLRAAPFSARRPSFGHFAVAFCGHTVDDALPRSDWPAADGPRTLRGPPLS